MPLTPPPDKNTAASGISSLKPDLVWIEPGFALGSKPYDYQRGAVSQIGIRAVVALHEPEAGEGEAWQVHGVRFYCVPMLLHCLAGINRAPTFVAAVLCQTLGMNVDKALAVVKSRRAAAKPTSEQEKSLRVWYQLRCKPSPAGLSKLKR
jgi:hypothetical protein